MRWLQLTSGMHRLTPIFFIAFLTAISCTAPSSETRDPTAGSAYVRERISVDEARKRILAFFTDPIQKAESRLTQTTNPNERACIENEIQLLKTFLAARQERLDIKLRNYNPETDQIWTFEKPVPASNGGGTSGILLIKKNKVIYLD